MIIKIFVNGKRHGMPYSQYSSESIGSRSSNGQFHEEIQVYVLFSVTDMNPDQQYHITELNRHEFPHFALYREIQPVFRVTAIQDPVVTFFISSSSNLLISKTTCMLCITDPSFNATKAIFLFPRFVLTQPFTCCFTAKICANATIL